MPISASTFDSDIGGGLRTAAARLGLSSLKLTPHSPRKMICKFIRWLVRMGFTVSVDDCIIDAHFRWKDKESKSTMRIRYTGQWPREQRTAVTLAVVTRPRVLLSGFTTSCSR